MGFIDGTGGGDSAKPAGRARLRAGEVGAGDRPTTPRHPALQGITPAGRVTGGAAYSGSV